MITLAARAAAAKSKVGRKVKSKVAAGRKGGKVTATKRGRPVKRDKAGLKPASKASVHAVGGYSSNEARIKRLKYQMKYYRANKAHILAYHKKYAKRTKKGTVPLYMQGKGKGRRPIHDRLPRLNGKAQDRGRDLTTGKRVQTTRTGRANERKAVEKYDEKKEKARKGSKPGPAKRGRPAKVVAAKRGRPAKVVVARRGRPPGSKNTPKLAPVIAKKGITKAPFAKTTTSSAGARKGVKPGMRKIVTKKKVSSRPMGM